MSLSSVSVVGNALLLRGWHPPRLPDPGLPARPAAFQTAPMDGRRDAC
jgi:hypothetical protein